MGAAKKLIEKKALRNLVPLNALSAIHLEEISRKAVIEEVRSGRYVFKKGDRDYQSVYLIEGKVELIENGREVVDTVDAGSEAARHPLAHKQPRNLSARAAGSVTVARIDSSLLDVLLTWDESSGYDVVEIDAEENDDWMTRMLQSEAFLQLPPSNIHQLLMRLEEVALSAGDPVVRQGDEGDYFYIVKNGRLAVSRKASPRSKEVLLAELGEGACFGEEALVSDASRNASVTMLTDGTLMRLSKDDFKQLLCAPMVHEVAFVEAQELISQGARWLDVRLPGEFENRSIKESINLPLSALRDQSAELDSDVSYVVCCDTGRRSAAGAFLLRQRGLSVYTLKNGMMDVPEEALNNGDVGAGGVEQGRDAEIIPFGADGRGESEASRRDQGAALRSAAVANHTPTESSDPGRAAPRQQLEQAQKQLEELQTRLQEAEAQRAEEQAISARVIEQIDTLEKDLQRALKERAEFEQQLTQHQADSQSQKTELAQLSARLDREQGEHEKRARLLEQELVQIRDDYKQLGQRAGVLAGERDSVVTELEKARGELVELREQLAGQQGEISSQTDALRRELELRGREIETEKDQRRVLEQQLTELADKHEQLERDLGEFSQRERDLQAQLQEAEQRAEAAVEAARNDASGAREALEQRIAELQSELESHQARVQDGESQRDALEHKLATAEQGLSEAQDRERGLQAQLQEAEQRAEAAVEAARNDASGAREALEQRIAELQSELESHQARVQDGESQRDALEHKLATAEQGLSEAQERERGLQAQLQEAEQRAEAAVEAARNDASGAREALEQRIAELQSELESHQARVQDGESQRDELEHKLATAEQGLSEAQDRERGLQAQLQEAEQRAEAAVEAARNDASGAREALEQRIAELQSELESHQARVQDGESQRDALEHKLATAEQGLSEAQERERGLQAQLQEAEQRAEAAVEAARNDASGAREALEQRIAELQSELESHQARVQDGESQRDELEHKLGAVQQALTEAQDRERDLQAQLQRAEEGAANYQQDVKQAGEHAEGLRHELEEEQRKRTEAEQRAAELEERLAAETTDHKSDIATVRDALARAQDERENVKRDQKRLMESLRKTERKLERERQDHEAEVHRLRKELKQTAGESNAGLASELEALQKKLKQGLTDREELEINLGERSAQLEDVQAQVDKLAKQLAQAQDSARQAEQQLVEATQAANEEMTIRLNAEQEIQQALQLDLKKALLERDEHQTQLALITQESVELRAALESAQARLGDQEQAERLVDELREQLQSVERERDAARDAEQSLRQEADRLRADAEVSRGLETMVPESAGDEVLKEQLEQARRNADQAMRERGEAEQQLLDLRQEVARLRAELSGVDTDATPEAEPVQINSLDSEDPYASSMLQSDLNESQTSANSEAAEAILLDEDYSASAVRDDSDAGKRGVAKGLIAAVVVVASLAGGALWWFGWPPSSGTVNTQQSAAGAEVPGAHGQIGQDGVVAETDAVGTDAVGTDAAETDAVEAKAPAGRMPDFIRGVPDLATLRPEPNDPAVDEDASESAPQPLAESNVEAQDATASTAAASQPEVPQQPGAEFRDRLRVGGSGPSMVELRSDSFQMGSGSASPNFDERPRRDITLKRFALSKYEVTFEQYDRFAEATGRARPRSAGRGRGSRPVTNVSWKDAVAYAEWLSAQTGHRYRLPTEAEWEFAARAGTITRYWWGNKVGTAQANCFDCGTEWSGRETAPVGSFPASPFGLHDLAGNAREWVKDCYAPNYKEAPVDGSAVDASQCQQRVIRGGSYSSPSTKLRVTTRDQGEPDMRLDDLGFRVAREY